MADVGIDRRQALRGAGVAAGGAALGAFAFATPASANGSGDAGVSGSWLIIRQDDGSPATTTAVVSFAGGGVIVVHDINPPGAPFTGSWAEHDGDRFRATFWTGQQGNGPTEPGATLRVRVRGQIRHGDLTGAYTFAVFDPTTGAEVQDGSGKVLSGHRIEP